MKAILTITLCATLSLTARPILAQQDDEQPHPARQEQPRQEQRGR